MMNHNNDKMDEEKTFEVIQEESAQVYTNPQLVKRGLTEVSAMFDRNGKGYLDDTERALRRMDSMDKGYLGIDKVCVIFESLQAEQERSSHLLEALRTESKKSLSLKRGVIALAVFTLLLALANVGTSFAIASLVKEVEVVNGDLKSTGSHVRVGTTARVTSFDMQSLPETRRRHLQSLVCETMVDTDPVTGVTEKECALQGTIKLNVADDIHEELKNTDHVILTCNGEKSLVYGTYKLPAGEPGEMMMGSFTYKVYPTVNTTDDKYAAVQNVRVPAVRATPADLSVTPPIPAVPAVPSSHCDAYFELAMYCPSDLIDGKQQECLVMSAFMPTQACQTPPTVCGPPPQTAGTIIV